MEYKFSSKDLKKGKCKSCLTTSEEILINDGRCLECIVFEESTNELLKKLDN